MAASKLSSTSPTLVLKRFEDVNNAFRNVRDVLQLIESWINRAIKVVNDHGTRLTPLTSSGAPATTPTDVGLYNLDTAVKDMYISVGTASSADWKKITP